MPEEYTKRIYVCVGTVFTAVEVSSEIQNQADQYRKVIQRDESNWTGMYERNLPQLNGDKSDVFIRVDETGVNFGYYSQSGFVPISFIEQEINKQISFGTMVVHYATEDYPNHISPESVEESLHKDDTECWWKIIDDQDK